MLSYAKFRRTRQLLGSFLLLAALILFIPAPPSYEDHTYSIFPFVPIQVVLFGAGRVVSSELDQFNLMRSFAETIIFMSVCIFHTLALNML